VQAHHGVLHPTRNLTDPIDETPRWVRDTAVHADIRHCLTLSMGFGGMNTALVVRGPRNEEGARGHATSRH
jgi:malonyl-ACP decarboxylase